MNISCSHCQSNTVRKNGSTQASKSMNVFLVGGNSLKTLRIKSSRMTLKNAFEGLFLNAFHWKVSVGSSM
jgi:hypothetical protein